MTSERQKIANRANARRSTGPKTAKGKEVVRLNALRHGLLARDIVLPGEDAEAFENLWNDVRATLSPVGPIEEFLTDQVTNIIWKHRRLTKAETALFHSRIHGLKADRLRKEVRSHKPDFPCVIFPSRITDEAAHAEASEAFAEADYERERDEVLLGLAIDADAKEGDAFSKMSRYARGFERSLFRMLDELRQMQDRRRNGRSSRISDAVSVAATDTDDEHSPS